MRKNNGLGFKSKAGAFIKRILPLKFGRVKKQGWGIQSRWGIEHYRDGKLIGRQVAHNISTDEFINLALDRVLAQLTWYMGVYSDDYSPNGMETYAVPYCTEATGYNEATRPVWQHAGIADKEMTNLANKATYTMDGSVTALFGCMLTSLDAKGDTEGDGALGPIVRFDNPIADIIAGDIVKVYMTIGGYDVEGGGESGEGEEGGGEAF
jgi:hypothetical protein